MRASICRKRSRVKKGEEPCSRSAAMTAMSTFLSITTIHQSSVELARDREARTHPAAVRILFEVASISLKIAENKSLPKSTSPRASRRVCRITRCNVMRVVKRSLSPTCVPSKSCEEIRSNACKGSFVRIRSSELEGPESDLSESQEEQVGD
jgi:hypothetical protein